jgi:hypothetical protein
VHGTPAPATTSSAPLLEEAGYSTTALTLPGVGADPPVTSTDEDVAFIHSAVSALADSGKAVVVVMHSHGAIPGSDAMKGLSKKERSEKDVEGESRGIGVYVRVDDASGEMHCRLSESSCQPTQTEIRGTRSASSACLGTSSLS